MHPDAQKKAQEELDRVVGHNRLPEFEDRPSLPYITALLKEVTRWHVGTPIGLPHRTTADDNYNGYFIPAGTIVMPNIWYVFPSTQQGRAMRLTWDFSQVAGA